jgi:hypothetical protein
MSPTTGASRCACWCHFALPLALAMRGVAGELPFQPEDTTPEPWGAGMAAEAKRFRKR